jgi:predicted nucleic acid-binding protein
MQNRDEADWPVLAAAIVLDCPIWTQDADFLESVWSLGFQRVLGAELLGGLRIISHAQSMHPTAFKA